MTLRNIDSFKAVGIIPQDRNNSFSLRLKLMDGSVGVAKLLVITAVAENYGDGTVRVNAHQGLEISGVTIDRLHEAIKALRMGGVELASANDRITDNRF